MKIAVIFGTRPEAIKLAPVILRLHATSGVSVCVINTGQHREMCRQALASFAIEADADLDVMLPNQSLGQLTGRLFTRTDELLHRETPDWVLVQGDTTSAMVGATAAFYRQIKVGHVEAGLRTFQFMSPFPEEINRTFIGHLAALHFAPTEGARANLLRAGLDERTILVTGNTIVDAIELLKPRLAGSPLGDQIGAAVRADLENNRLILVTSHRRESFGPGIEGICLAIRQIVRQFDDVVVVYPVHLNPNVQAPVRCILGSEPRVHLLEPLDYLDLLGLIQRATLILSDSGGLQEEAPSFGKPILILREVTERPEVVSVGAGRLVGTDADAIVNNARELLHDRAVYARMARAGNPFGDGKAAARIVKHILAYGPSR